jgi:hypothetical protein
MIRQARTGDAVLVKSRKMTGRTHKHSRGGWGEEGEKTTENKIVYIGPVGLPSRAETRNQKVRPASGDLSLNGEVHLLKQDLTILIFTYEQPPLRCLLYSPSKYRAIQCRLLM